MKTYTNKLIKLPNNGIFVFGSNPQGRHGKGAALIAKIYFGAKYGQARGLQGKSYAIVTKDLTKSKHPSVPTKDIKNEIKELYQYAIEHPELEFYVAYSGSGRLLSGFTPKEMANLYSCTNIPNNIIFEEEFSKLLTI